MSFSSTNITVGYIGSFSFDGVYGVAGSGISPPYTGLYYSSDSGVSWSQSNITDKRIYAVNILGNTAVAASYNNEGIFYSTNYGQTWSPSNITTGSFFDVKLSASYGLACSSSSTGITGIYRTTNGGQTWALTSITTNAWSSVYISGTNAIALSYSYIGIYYSTNSGQNWTIATGGGGYSYDSISFSGNNGVAGTGLSASGALYTNNLGQNWSPCSGISGRVAGVSLSGSNGIAGTSTSGLYYSTNYGQSWTQSNITSGYFRSVFLSGNIGIAGEISNTSAGGIYTTGNGGKTWAKSPIPSSTGIRAVYIVGSNGVAGSNNNTGIYRNTSPMCYMNANILCLVDNMEQYINISDITKDMLVKTYKDGYKKVCYVKSFDYLTFNCDNKLECLYKLKGGNLCVTGGHSILVDELTDEEMKSQKEINFEQTIHDKKLLLACFSDKFEQIYINTGVKLYHISLENDDENSRYGIYLEDDILSETTLNKNLRDL